jgi:hypothetical protein
MQTMARETWTDERLDDLAKHMDDGFREVKAEIKLTRAALEASIGSTRKGLEGSIEAMRAELKEEIASTRTELSAEIKATRVEMTNRFDKLTYTLIAGLIGLLATHYLG